MGISVITDYDYYYQLLDKINAATTEVLATVYSWHIVERYVNDEAKTIFDAVVDARNRGCVVQILLNKSTEWADTYKWNADTYTRLLMNKVGVRFWEGPYVLHAKLWIIDAKYAFVGSHNISRRSMKESQEVSIFIDDLALINTLRNYFYLLWI